MPPPAHQPPSAQREDPIHVLACSEDVAWSTINAGEAIPGVVTPLTWSFFGDATDRAIKQTFADIGALASDQVRAEVMPERRMWDVFYGRAAANLNMFRWIGDGMPGTSGDAIEEQLFGQVRPGVSSSPRWDRYPVAAVKLPRAALGMTRALRAQVGPIEPFWRASVAPGALANPTRARAALSEAHERFSAVMVPHTLAAMLCQGLYEQLRQAAARAGLHGLELRLVTGYGQMAETDVVSDLWQVSRERMSLDEFILAHGYHGPNEGELSSVIWRLDRRPLLDLLDAYRAQDDDHDPRRIERRRGLERVRAEQELLAALPRARRLIAATVMRIAATLIPLRGTGKAAFLQCVDVAREAARVIGADLAEHGLLERAQDAFMLTLEELLDPNLAAGAAELAATRRAHHQRYLSLDIPDLFYGVPVPVELGSSEQRLDDGELITGTAVSPGVVRGRARVLLDPLVDEPLRAGEILVCRSTDPSWASAMMIAQGLVIDIGGAISHGAIVARELGIPCAIGTRNAAKRIVSGDLIELDGGRGEVRIIERATGHGPAAALGGEADHGPGGGAGRGPGEPERGGSRMESTEELALLRAIGLKGRAEAQAAGRAAGVGEAEDALGQLAAAGLLREARGGYLLSPEGRERLSALLEGERATVDPQIAAEAYDAFTPVNDQFKALASEWQTRDGVPNDHGDAGYDQAVLGRLPTIHTQVSAILAELSGPLPRLRLYASRLDAALAKVRDGDGDWLLKPLIDSYHTVWFELHEELIALTGRSRSDEAAAGRAQ